MKYILPYNDEVPIKTYPYIANYMGILAALNYDISGILFNHYLTIFYLPITGQINFWNRFHTKSLFKKESYALPTNNQIEFVKENLLKNRYINILLNIKVFSDYHKYDFIHDVMIYGFDDDKKLLNLVGYKEEIYGAFQISYDEFLKSIPKQHQKNTYKKHNPMYYHFFWLDDNFKLDAQNKKTIICEIYKSLLHLPPFCFNISAYSNLGLHVKLFYYLQLKPFKRSLLDSRDFRILYERAFILKNMIGKYTSDNLLVSKYDKVLELLQINLNLTRKFVYVTDNQKRKKIIQTIVANLKECKKNEKQVLRSLLKEIK